MGNLAFGYEQIPASSWAYLSSLLMLALFFKFNRFWALRNLDLILLILLAPGLLMVNYGGINRRAPANVEQAVKTGDEILVGEQDGTADPGEGNETRVNRDAELGIDSGSETSIPQVDPNSEVTEPTPASELTEADWVRRAGFVWLFSVGLLLLLRMMLDPLMIRRPLLEPNLSSGGLVFLAISMLSVSIANIVVTSPSADEIAGAESGAKMARWETAEEEDRSLLREHGPGYALFHALVVPTVSGGLEVVAKVLAIVGQLALVGGLIFVGYQHFFNFRIGVGVAVIYLTLPYTSLFSGHVMHLLPAALIVWAVGLYRRPLWAES
ncbi:MAG: hypothetical protein R3C03_18455 [Pirellulaceae bacterium]